jgi:hypothetical protein
MLTICSYFKHIILKTTSYNINHHFKKEDAIMSKKPVKRYTIGEEVFNSVSHGVGALLAVIGASVIVTLAACFGDILGEIMSFGFNGSDKRIAFEVGKHVGAWIYVADALDDAAKDMETGNYNPFLRMYGAIPSPEQLNDIELALKNELYGLEAALDLIDEEFLNEEAVFPSEETIERCESLVTLDEKTTKLYSDYWKKVKAK